MSDVPRHHANRQVLNRSALTQRLVARLRDEAVIGGIGNTNFDLWMAGQRPQNFYMLGSMGLASPIALGVAIAQPERGVVALEGDGSLLMQLGCLATVGKLQPRNLLIVVWDNASYQITGGQAVSAVDFVAVAQAAGIASAHWAADEGSFEGLVERCLWEGGPHLIAARIDGKPATGTTERDPAAIGRRFREGIAPRA
jgi:thiamine pyrophosphate-dependent acetolactate synthase large subunit-like protein